MPSIGPMEIVIVLVIALIIFGPKRLPELGRSVGGGMREFKETISRATPTRDDLTAETAEPEAARAD
jgi:sec-independent protein translocase protein TatA